MKQTEIDSSVASPKSKCGLCRSSFVLRTNQLCLNQKREKEMYCGKTFFFYPLELFLFFL